MHVSIRNQESEKTTCLFRYVSLISPPVAAAACLLFGKYLSLHGTRTTIHLYWGHNHRDPDVRIIAETVLQAFQKALRQHSMTQVSQYSPDQYRHRQHDLHYRG